MKEYGANHLKYSIKYAIKLNKTANMLFLCCILGFLNEFLRFRCFDFPKHHWLLSKLPFQLLVSE